LNGRIFEWTLRLSIKPARVRKIHTDVGENLPLPKKKAAAHFGAAGPLSIPSQAFEFVSEITDIRVKFRPANARRAMNALVRSDNISTPAVFYRGTRTAAGRI
jgi:hypothetical protein